MASSSYSEAVTEGTTGMLSCAAFKWATVSSAEDEEDEDEDEDDS